MNTKETRKHSFFKSWSQNNLDISSSKTDSKGFNHIKIDADEFPDNQLNDEWTNQLAALVMTHQRRSFFFLELFSKLGVTTARNWSAAFVEQENKS